MIIFLFILCIILILSLCYVGWNYFILGKKYLELNDVLEKQQQQYLKDFKNVVETLQNFVKNSTYLEYNSESKTLLTYLRSFIQKLSSYVITHENEEAILIEDSKNTNNNV